MNSSKLLIDYKYKENLSDKEKYIIDTQIQLAIAKVLHQFCHKDLSDFSIGDYDYFIATYIERNGHD